MDSCNSRLPIYTSTCPRNSPWSRRPLSKTPTKRRVIKQDAKEDFEDWIDKMQGFIHQINPLPSPPPLDISIFTVTSDLIEEEDTPANCHIQKHQNSKIYALQESKNGIELLQGLLNSLMLTIPPSFNIAQSSSWIQTDYGKKTSKALTNRLSNKKIDFDSSKLLTNQLHTKQCSLPMPQLRYDSGGLL